MREDPVIERDGAVRDLGQIVGEQEARGRERARGGLDPGALVIPRGVACRK